MHLALSCVTEELVASVFKIERIRELGTTLAEISRQQGIHSTIKLEATRYSETSVVTKPNRRHIQEHGILDVWTAILIILIIEHFGRARA
jgi:hypothetical protein